MKLAITFLFLAAVLAFTGCGMAPLKGGKATSTAKGSAIVQTVNQSDNPAAASRQGQETEKVKSYTLPAGSRLVETSVAVKPDGLTVTNSLATLVSAPMPVIERESTKATTELGPAQKDTARELSAKLASLKGIVWVGVALFLFGLATLFYPPLKVLVGSVTTSVAIIVGGLALMVLPSLIVGNELLILAGVTAAVGLWFLAHRHGHLHGLVAANKGAGDINNVKPKGTV